MRGWIVALADGTHLNSVEHTWADVSDEVLALKVWYEDHALILTDQSHYGDPSTLKAGVDVEDAKFSAVLKALQEAPCPTDCI